MLFRSHDDDIAQFIARIERNDHAFQRSLSQAKVRQLRNFYETAVTQPPIPGTVLLFTSETLRYQSAADLAHDITRYLGDQPIEARPPSLVYQFTRLARRHQAAFAAAAYFADRIAVRAETARWAAVIRNNNVKLQ